jgi:spermidine/putrescine transport system permease protein
MEQPVLADHSGGLAAPAGAARHGAPGARGATRRRRVRPGKVLAPYLLTLPGGLWLLALFLIPLVVMLSLSLQTCNSGTGACVMTWHWGEFGQQLSLYHAQFLLSLLYAGCATAIDILVSFPIAYWIAFHGGRRKNFFLLMLLVPFFVSFVIRTVVWQFILSDQGVILGGLKHAGILPQSFHVLATGYAVVAGLAYNYLPFTALPLYVAIERIDKRVLDAAYDLYASRREAFARVILPLTVPGLFAAFLLTFIPALGDYVNQQLLGGTSNTMIGTVIQNAFLVSLDYAGGSALSAMLLAIAIIGIFAYARLLGSRSLEEYI